MRELVTKTQIVKRESGEVLLSSCLLTENSWERMKGLLAHESLSSDEGLWISPCTSIHTFFMKFPIDVAFLDKSGKILSIYSAMKPWRLSGIHFKAAGVLEMQAGLLNSMNISKGERLILCPSS